MGFNYTGQRKPKRWNRLFILPKWWSIVIWVIVIAVVISIQGCVGAVIDRPIEKMIYFPIIDRNGTVHDYKKGLGMEMNQVYDLYCTRHYKWERIQVRYGKIDSSGKELYKRQYIIKPHRK